VQATVLVYAVLQAGDRSLTHALSYLKLYPFTLRRLLAGDAGRQDAVAECVLTAWLAGNTTTTRCLCDRLVDMNLIQSINVVRACVMRLAAWGEGNSGAHSVQRNGAWDVAMDCTRTMILQSTQQIANAERMGLEEKADHARQRVQDVFNALLDWLDGDSACAGGEEEELDVGSRLLELVGLFKTDLRAYVKIDASKTWKSRVLTQLFK
jgi:hypothetical protein